MSIRRLFAIVAIGVLGFASVAQAQSYDPSSVDWSGEALPSAFRFDTPDLVPLTVSIPATSSAGTTLERDERLDQLSLSLDYDVDRVFEYIHNHIRTTPTFGLTKGAFGTMLDEAGNPFDQAHLMVALLDAADAAASTAYNARYVYGTLDLSGSEFTEMFGPASARGACELLAAGGIPARVDGTTSACAGRSNTQPPSSVEMRHIWVRANVDGVDYDFDPSQKEHLFHAPHSAILSEAPTAASLQSAVGEGALPSGVTQFDGYNPDALAATLEAATADLRQAIDVAETTTEMTEHAGSISVHEPLNISQILGGFDDVQPVFAFHINQAVRETGLDGHIALSVLTEIPDTLRTYIHFRLYANESVGVLETTQVAADLASRRLWVSESNAVGLPIGDDPQTTVLSLLVDEEYMTLSDGSPAQVLTNVNAVQGLPYWLEVAVHHPIYAGTGVHPAARSRYEFKSNDAFPGYILLGLGERGDGTQVRNVGEVPFPGRVAWKLDEDCVPPPGQEFCTIEPDGDPVAVRSAQLSSLVSAGEAFLSQASAIADLYEGVAGRRRAAHHTVGLASMWVELNPFDWPVLVDGEYRLQPELAAQRISLDAAGRAGVARQQGSGGTNTAFALSVSSALSGLEELVLQQVTDAPSTAGVPAMFDWFVRQSRTEAFTSGVASDYQIQFIEIPNASQVSARGAAIDTLWFSPSSPSGTEYATFSEHEQFTTITPQSMRLGPSRLAFRTNSVPNQPSVQQFISAPNCSSGCSIEDLDAPGAYSTRFPAHFSYQESVQTVAVAPVAFVYKGGAGASFPEDIEPPDASREALDDAYESWATAFDVDLRTGGVTLTPPADISTGAGGYPYSLSFERTYSSDSSSIGSLGPGWVHNHEVRLSTGTNIPAGLGRMSPRQGLATILAATVTWDLFSSSANYSENAVTAMLLQHWWVEQIFDNEVSISRGNGSESFIHQPDGRWEPAPGSTASLTRSGARVAEANQSIPRPGYNPIVMHRVVSEAFNRSGWSFEYVSEGGVTETFTYGFDLTTGAYDPRIVSQRTTDSGRTTNAIGSGRTFLIRSAEFPFGVDLTYSYQSFISGGHYQGERLEEVANSAPFERSLQFAYTNSLPPSLPPVSNLIENEETDPHSQQDRSTLETVTTDDGRFVEFGYQSESRRNFEGQTPRRLHTVTNAVNETTTYNYVIGHQDYAGNGDPVPYAVFAGGVHAEWLRLTSLALPTSVAGPDLEFAYNDFGEIESVADAEDNIWFYRSGDRGFSLDPDGQASREYYDRDGRLFASVSPREVLSRREYDSLGRPVRSWTGFSSNLAETERRTQTLYDDLGNVVVSRNLGGTDDSGVALTSEVIERVSRYEYAAFPELPTREIDAEGYESRTCYHASQPSCSAIASSPHDGLPRAAYGPSGEEALYEYDSYGRLERQRVRVEN
jgi:hypothetical protein